MNERKGSMEFLPPFGKTPKLGNLDWKSVRVDVQDGHTSLIKKGSHLSMDTDAFGNAIPDTEHLTNHKSGIITNLPKLGGKLK